MNINKIRLSRDDVAWIGITVKGTNAIVKVKEADKAPNILDENKYRKPVLVFFIYHALGRWRTFCISLEKL